VIVCMHVSSVGIPHATVSRPTLKPKKSKNFNLFLKTLGFYQPWSRPTCSSGHHEHLLCKGA